MRANSGNKYKKRLKRPKSPSNPLGASSKMIMENALGGKKLDIFEAFCTDDVIFNFAKNMTC